MGLVEDSLAVDEMAEEVKISRLPLLVGEMSCPHYTVFKELHQRPPKNIFSNLSVHSSFSHTPRIPWKDWARTFLLSSLNHNREVMPPQKAISFSTTVCVCEALSFLSLPITLKSFPKYLVVVLVQMNNPGSFGKFFDVPNDWTIHIDITDFYIWWFFKHF